MSVSARNRFSGSVSAIKIGIVNAEVVIDIGDGEQIVSTITLDSLKMLGLAIGMEVVALVKAPALMIATGDDGACSSARNHLLGSVMAIKQGAINSEVILQLRNQQTVQAIITNEAVAELGLKNQSQATVLFNAGSVILTVPVLSEINSIRHSMG